MDIDDAIKNILIKRAISTFTDPTQQTHFCQRCARPVIDHGERLDGAKNIDDLYEKYCSACLNSIKNERRVSDEQNPL